MASILLPLETATLGGRRYQFLVTVFHQLLIFTADSLYGRWSAMEDQSAIIYPDAPWTDPTTLR